MIGFIIGLMVGMIAGLLLMSLLKINTKRAAEDEAVKREVRIKEQTQRIFELYQEMIKYKGAAASEETRANLLAKVNEELQGEVNELTRDYKDVFAEYKKLYLELDSIKAAEVRKFPAPEELIKVPVNGNETKLNVLLDS